MVNRHTQVVCVVLTLLLLLAVSACTGWVASQPTQAPLPTHVPTLPPSPTPEPTQTLPPTPIPSPTATLATQDEVTTTATATAEVTPTPEKIILQGKADFADDINPLTGEQVDDPDSLNRRPLAIKISNAPAKWVRPQSGLNDADLVFEHITEAGITRFTIIVYGETPQKVGPIRSARLIDLELPAMYDASLAYSGSSEGVRQKLLNADFRPRILFAYEPGYYRTGEDKPTEHTFYGDPETFWRVLEERAPTRRPPLIPL